MRPSPRRWFNAHRALAGLVVGVLMFSGAPLAAWSAPTPDPTSTESVSAQDEATPEAKDAEATPAPDSTPEGEKSPSDDETTSADPTGEPTDTAEESAKPEEPETPGEAAEDGTSADEAAADDEPGQIVPQVIPPATGNNAVINVKVGGNRTSLTAVGALQGVVLGFYNTATGGTPVYTCTSDVDGDCSVIVPNTQGGGANRDRQFWVRQISAPGTHYTNPNLGTGATVASDPYRFQTCPQLRAGVQCLSTQTGDNGFMIATGGTNDEASGGIWQDSLDNPTFPAKCGINVAILHDLSNSVSAADLVAMKAASNTFVDALTGTPSQVSTFTFASAAPAAGAANTTLALTSVSTAAGATTVKNKINGMTLPGGSGGGTNWDRGIYQIAQSTSTFDVLMVITDGNPTFYGAQEGPGNRTRFREVENGIFSANAVKAENTRLIALGVGVGVDSAGSGLNLRSISGPTLNSDYYQTTNYAAAGAALRALALGNCTGSLTVVKQVVPAGAPANSTAGAVPQGGWTFTGTGSTGITFSGTNPQQTAGGTGAANFPLTFAPGTTSGPVTLNETLQAGYTLHTINGDNATCTRVDTGQAVTATNSGATGFTVNVNTAYPVSCMVYNQPPQPLATVVLNKQWTINGGAPIPDGQQPEGLVATGTLNGTTRPWGQVQTGFRQDDIVAINETTDLSGLPLCTLTSARLTSTNGTTVDLGLPSDQTLLAGDNTYTITNAVTCDTRLKLTKTVQGGTAAPADWTLTGIAPEGALAGPNGTTGVTGTVTPSVTYTLTEDDPHPEYRQVVAPNAVLRPGSSGSWNCQEVQPDGTTVIPGFADGLNGGVTVPFGRYISCEAVNQTSTLELRKVVVNDNGGTAVPADWTLTATPIGTFPAGLPAQTVTGSTDGVSFNVRPGVDYQLTEAGPAGYTQTDLVCAVFPTEQRIDVVNLRPLDTGVCTFTNDDDPSTLTLVKTVTNDNGGSAVPTQWTLAAGGPTPISGATGSATVTDAVVDAGEYTLSESGGPAGYTPGTWSCTGGTQTGTSVLVPNGADVTCTIDNNDQPAQLTLIKTVTNDNGGTAQPTEWTLTGTGPTSISGVTGSAPVTNAVVNAGSYQLEETGGPDGYAAGTWSCTGGELSGATVSVPSGGNVTCTIDNNDQAAQLTLVKTVTNDNGGTAQPAAWTLAAGGPTPIAGTTGSATVTNAPVSAGTYALSESGGPAGYAAEPWSCTGGTLTGASVVVPTGGNVTCTINNNDQAAQLTLVKVVDQGTTGGTALPADWTLTADGPTDVTGPGNSAQVTGVTVDAGSYALSESGGPDGYTAGTWSCSEGGSGATVTVPNGGNVTCTITNTAQQPTLTLVKTVTNDNGGTAVATDWTLTADGPTTGVSGATGTGPVTDVPVAIGDYDLSEAGGPTGYTAGDWTCTGGDQDESRVTIALGDDVVCTIDNDDQPAQLTLVKVVDNGDTGADAAPADWTLTATGPTTITGDGNSTDVTDQAVDAGAYDLTETDGPDGYTASTWDCGDAVLVGATVTVPNGGDVTCTITNTAEPVSLTLVKVVDNGTTGATTPATAWTLTATGPTVIEGTTPATGATEVGTYDLTENGPAGYDASDWVCTGATSTTDDSVTLELGDAATCTITNTAIAPRLTLVKEVVNDHGGTAEPEDWTLSAAGPTTGVTGPTGSTTVTSVPVAIGSYALTESGGPTGYTAGAWSCEGGTQSGASVAIALGDDVTCTIINNDQPALLTLVKVVEDPEGSNTTYQPVDWTLTADPQGITGQDSVSGNGDPTSAGGVNAVEVFAGPYELSEDGPAGFEGSLWECTGGVVTQDIVTVPNGGNVTCTITNTAIAPRLTLVKEVVNDNGGTAEATDWTLSADGPSPISGATGSATVTDAAVQVGDYTLDETGPSATRPPTGPASPARCRSPRTGRASAWPRATTSPAPSSTTTSRLSSP